MWGYDPYMDYCSSDYEPLDPEEEARLLKEIENDPTIDWHQEGIDCQNYKPGDKIEWPREEDGEYGAGSDGEDDEDEGSEGSYYDLYEGEPRETGSNVWTSDESGGESDDDQAHPSTNISAVLEEENIERREEDEEEEESGDDSSDSQDNKKAPSQNASIATSRKVLGAAANSNAEAPCSTSASAARAGQKRRRTRDDEPEEEEEEEHRDAKGKGRARASDARPPSKKSKSTEEGGRSQARRTFKDAIGTSKADF